MNSLLSFPSCDSLISCFTFSMPTFSIAVESCDELKRAGLAVKKHPVLLILGHIPLSTIALSAVVAKRTSTHHPSSAEASRGHALSKARTAGPAAHAGEATATLAGTCCSSVLRGTTPAPSALIRR